VGELTQHLGSVHRFHTRHVTRGVTDRPEPFAAQLPPDADLLDWFDTGRRAARRAARRGPRQPRLELDAAGAEGRGVLAAPDGA